ncbi:MAG: hypothetical protein JWQ52_964 [Phenylobacterium sp.]|jgi:hypothetical protein|nr:hypothetical protein [Phenylobacterium sp.]
MAGRAKWPWWLVWICVAAFVGQVIALVATHGWKLPPVSLMMLAALGLAVLISRGFGDARSDDPGVPLLAVVVAVGLCAFGVWSLAWTLSSGEFASRSGRIVTADAEPVAFWFHVSLFGFGILGLGGLLALLAFVRFSRPSENRRIDALLARRRMIKEPVSSPLDRPEDKQGTSGG